METVLKKLSFMDKQVNYNSINASLPFLILYNLFKIFKLLYAYNIIY